jgi:hypothetical protein
MTDIETNALLLLQEADRSIAVASVLILNERCADIVVDLCNYAVRCSKAAYNIYTGLQLEQKESETGPEEALENAKTAFYAAVKAMGESNV